MPSKDELDVVAFLADALEMERSQITIWTRVRQDLKLDGDDAADLLANYSYAFHVDTDTFRFNDYFNTGGNAHPVLAWWLSLFGNGKPLRTLTVRDLVRGAEQGILRGA